MLFHPFVYALDNPEAKDYVSQFKKESQIYEAKIESSNKNVDLQNIYNQYIHFLEKELLKGGKQMLNNLSDAQSKQIFIKSENRWEDYKNQEFEFIDTLFSRNTVGSSYIISRGAAKVSILKTRVIQLYRYLKHFPPS